MNHREPQAGRSDESAGAPGGQAVWESELPWEFPAGADDTVVGGAAAASTGSGLAGRPASAAVPASVPTYGPPSVPSPPMSPALAPAPAHAAVPVPEAAEGPHASEGALTVEGSRPSEGSRASEVPRPSEVPHASERRAKGRRPRSDARERPASRGHLAKPLLAGAGILSALFLLTPHLIDDDAPSRSVQAGAEDADPESTPDAGGPDGATAAPSPAASGAPDTGDGTAAGHDRIAEVAATASAESGRPLAALSEPRATAEGTATAGGGTADSTPRATPEPSEASQQQWTSTAVDGTSVLEPGQSWSTNRIVLTFQGDGNLVLYDRQGTPLWWSGTAGQGGVRAVFQADGNLAVYAGDSRTVWSTRTDGHDGARLVLRADGDMVIQYGGSVVWSTGTAM